MGATGTAATGAPASSPTAGYLLSGGDNLQQFVNQQVEIRGTLQSPSTTGASATASPNATTDPAGAASGQGTMPTLRITSVRVLGGSCQR